jgi:hypothetical protein
VAGSDQPKSRLIGTVRMETPVLYFYTPAPLTVSVSVDFRQGAMTDWFPRATVTPAGFADVQTPGFRGTIAWKDVHVRPGPDGRFPADAGASHYYAARATDAAPLDVAGQSEKFLFYRGVGDFQPPLLARLRNDGGVAVESPSGEPLGDVMLFQHRSDGMAYAVRTFDGPRGVFPRLAGDGEFVPPTGELEAILEAHGLYAKEARAMVATWRDSWFETGTRVFYLAPRPFIDATLPLTVRPAPAATARVFVGRVEITTPDAVRDVSKAIDANDTATLLRYGRFLQPAVDRLMAGASPARQKAIRDAVRPVADAVFATPTCRAR